MPNGCDSPVGEDRRLRRPRRAVGGAEHADAAGAALGHEDVAVGRHAQRARTIEAGGELVHPEPRRDVQRCARRGATTTEARAPTTRVANGGGRLSGVMWRTTPGASLRQSP